MVLFDPVILQTSKEMEVFAVLLLVTLAVAAPVEVPAAEEFHEAMMNSDTTETFNPGVLDVVDELNVTSDTIMGYPDESRDFFEEIRNGDNNGVNLAAVVVPYIVLFIAVLLGATAALCMACCCVSKKIKEWKKKQNTKDVVPNVVPKDNEDDAERGNVTQSAPPSDSSVYSINVCRKVEYVPQDRSYFI